MKHFCTLFLVVLVIVCSCAKKNVEKKETIPWTSIEIAARNQIVTIYEDLDTASFQNAIYKRTSKQAFMGKYNLEKIEKTNFKISRTERDSLYAYVVRTITKPCFPETFCTDYVGNVSIKLASGRTTISCDYNSVCNWSNVSPETQKIYQLLRSKVKISPK